jgi:hypothetical protein
MASGSSEYSPIPPRAPLSGEPTDLERVEALFEKAAAGYLRTPWSWWSWSILLPAAALLTRRVASEAGTVGILLLWSVVILLGGLVEATLILGGRHRYPRTQIGGWVLRSQGNLSLVAVALSGVLAWRGLPGLVPAVWLLLIGHSFYMVGRLTFVPLRSAGVVFQLGGVVALVPEIDGLVVCAVCTFVGCAWVGLGVRRRLRGFSDGRDPA